MLKAILSSQEGPVVTPPPQPTVTLTGTSSTPSVPFTVTATVSEAVTDFTISDFLVVGSATLSAFANPSTLVYTVTVTPPASGDVSISVPAGSVFSPLFAGNLPSNVLNFSYSPPPATDYLTNIYDEWIGNRGLNLILSTGSVQKEYDWTGQRSGVKALSVGSMDPPDGGFYTLDGTADYFTIATNTYPGLTGAASVVFLVKCLATASRQMTLFDTNTNSPRLIFLVRISAANTNMGFKYNNVTYDCGAAFPFGSSFHVVVVKVNGAGSQGRVEVDGVQVGSTFSITGGGLAANTGQTLYLFNGVGSPASQFAPMLVQKVRIYNEYLSDAHSLLMATGDFAIPVAADTTSMHWGSIAGQSNNSPVTADNHIASYPSDLANGFPDVYLWQVTSNLNKFVPIPGGVDQLTASGSNPVRIGPVLKIAKDWRAAKGTDLLRITEFYVAATALAVAWDPLVAGSLQTTLLTYIKNSLALLKAEQRNIQSFWMKWNQSEGDSAVAPINYTTNGTTSVTNGSAVVTFSQVAKPILQAGMTLTLRSVDYTILSVDTTQQVTLTIPYAGVTEVLAASTNVASTNSYAFAYATNLNTLFQNVTDAVHVSFPGVTVRFIIVKLTTRAESSGKEPHAALCRAAQLAKVASDPTNIKLIDTDDTQADFVMVGGNVHYFYTGLIEIGRRAVLLMP